MAIKDFSYQLTVEVGSTTSDTYGITTYQWKPLTTVWADLKPLPKITGIHKQPGYHICIRGTSLKKYAPQHLRFTWQEWQFYPQVAADFSKEYCVFPLCLAEVNYA